MPGAMNSLLLVNAQIDSRMETPSALEASNFVGAMEHLGQPQSSVNVHSIIGIGFGPSNVALAIAAQAAGIDDVIFLEQKPSFSWHPGMLLDTSQLQVVFLKDLITLVDPSSKFTFRAYLKEQGRLDEFINLRKFFPSRIEFAYYYAWAAKQFAAVVRYSAEVKRVVRADDLFAVHYDDLATGHRRTVYGKNVVFADGGRPFVPAGIALSSRVVHSQDTLFALEREFPDYRSTARIAVVGSGQTAVDVLTYLRTRYPHMHVTALVRGFAKRALHEHHADVTHSSADIDMLPALYASYYAERVAKSYRFKLVRFHDAVEATASKQGVEVRFRDLLAEGAKKSYAFDLVILCTGHRRDEPIGVLDGVEAELLKDKEGHYVLTRNYAIAGTEGLRGRVYLQGYGERSHGFSEILVSLMPVRSKEIVEDILAQEGDGVCLKELDGKLNGCVLH